MAINITVSEIKVLHEPHGPIGGPDLRFYSRQPDISLHCKATDGPTGLEYHVECLLTPQLSPVTNYTAF